MVKSLYRGQRSAEILDPWRRQYYDEGFERVDTDTYGSEFLSFEAAEKLRPKLSTVELTLWRDCANALIAKNIDQKLAIAAADAAVKEADIDTESLDKWEDTEDD